MKAKLNDVVTRNGHAPEHGSTFIWDQQLKGFGLRLTAGGARSFVVEYAAPNGRPRRMTLGRYPALSVAAARKLALDVKARSYRGEDVLAAKRTTTEGDGTRPEARTLIELSTRYLAEYVARRRTKAGQHNERIYWRALVDGLGEATALTSITREEVDRLHERLSERTPVQANRILTSLKTALNQAMRWGWVQTNAALGCRRNAESGRERFLDDDELARYSALSTATRTARQRLRSGSCS